MYNNLPVAVTPITLPITVQTSFILCIEFLASLTSLSLGQIILTEKADYINVTRNVSTLYDPLVQPYKHKLFYFNSFSS